MDRYLQSVKGFAVCTGTFRHETSIYRHADCQGIYRLYRAFSDMKQILTDMQTAKAFTVCKGISSL